MTEDRQGRLPPVATFEDLEVFKRAYRLSLDVHRRSLELPAVEQRALADQIRRASKSICANWPKVSAGRACPPPSSNASS